MTLQPHILRLIQSHKAIDTFDYNIAVDWAMSLIRQGYESDNILMLASFSEPFDRFEIVPYVTAVLNDIGLEELNYEKAVLARVYFHMAEILDNKSVRKNLHALYLLSLEKEFEFGLRDFYMLYHAWDSLEEIGQNFYFEGADMNNIEEVLKAEAAKWVDKYINGNN